VTCTLACREGVPEGWPRRYPLEHVCCAVAYLLTVPEQRMQTAALRVIEKQISRAHAVAVRLAFKQRVLEAKAAK